MGGGARWSALVTMPLYAHQDALLDGARNSLRTHRATLLQSATGSGKTRLGSELARLCVAKGKRVIFSVHRDFLVDQTMLAFNDVGLSYGVIAAGMTPAYQEPAQIASIDSLRNRLEKVRGCDLLIIDEAHHALAPSWVGVIRYFMAKGAKVLGLTATPWRMSGAPLNTVFTDMVRGPSVRWLIDNGFLSEYRAFAPAVPDMQGVHTVAGDYKHAETAALMDKPTLVGDAVETYRKLSGGRALAFCVSVEHSQHVASQFSNAGIIARHLDGNTPKAERRQVIADFKTGKITVLTSVEIFGEGFDSPAVDSLILLRPTKSLGLHLQQLGRGLRTAPGKERVTILDHAGNILRLGMPDADYEWTLEGGAVRKKSDSEKAAPVRQCARCFRCYEPWRTACPECGAISEIKSRQVEQREGELVEISSAERELEKRAMKREVHAARTRDELEKIAAARKYHPGWVDHQLRMRHDYTEKYRRRG